MAPRRWTDEQLRAAVAEARSWRGVLRLLGLAATSSAQIRAARARAESLDLDTGHFTGQRRWSDDDLRASVATSRTWTDVAATLGLATGSSTTVLKGHAARLGLDVGHLTWVRMPTDRAPVPQLDLLPRAGSMLAASWFTLAGFEVAWPLEPCSYDLLASRGGELWRVQVKTTRMRAADGWRVTLTTGGRTPTPYDPDDVDHFFVVDGDLQYYLIPLAVVGGRNALHLAAYADFRVQRDPVADAPPPPSAGMDR